MRLPTVASFRTLPLRLWAVLGSHARRPQPAPDLRRHAELALDWLLAAHARSTDGGVPAFYDLLQDAWAPSYAETTGYLIPTLLAAAGRYGCDPARAAALAMAEYLLRVQTAEGAIPGWGAGATVYVFDTGQVLFGWLAAWRETGDARFEQAMIRAADWLLAQQEPAGYWTRYQFGGRVKSWDARVGWALAEVGLTLARPAYVAAGWRCLDWALTQQAADGWFDHVLLEPNMPAVTHTIAYAVEALLEAGLLPWPARQDRLAEERYLAAARAAADALLARQRPDGSLSALWAPGWRPLSRAACLTGDAQMARCWLRLYQYTGEARYLEAGRRALAFVAAAQPTDDRWPPIRGAIPGSWPVWGPYLRWRYPNWAAKFFLDALMLAEDLTLDCGGRTPL